MEKEIKISLVTEQESYSWKIETEFRGKNILVMADSIGDAMLKLDCEVEEAQFSYEKLMRDGE